MGRLGGRAVYGIASVAAMSDATGLTTRSCAAAAKAADASDKFFLQRVSQASVATKQELEKELPSLQVIVA